MEVRYAGMGKVSHKPKIRKAEVQIYGVYEGRTVRGEAPD